MIGPISTWLLVVVSLGAAAIMGMAIQRGATCMVSAVDEAYTTGRFDKARALAEASLWVGGPLALVALLGNGPGMPGSYPAGAMALVGGALLGVGAFVNKACVFGSIARIGSGNWHYLLTPPGFLAGSWLHGATLGTGHASASTGVSATAMLLIAGLFLLSVIVRGVALARSARQTTAIAYLSQPDVATLSIGLTFVVLLWTAGPWSYTQVLDRIAHGGMGFASLEVALLAALLGGAVLGGWSKRIRAAWDVGTAIRCIAGGALMGFASSLIPGGNDSLILIGLPAPQAYAWVAIGGMVLGIWGGLIAARNWRTLRASSQHGSHTPR